ncbi:MAG: glycosyl hydrolase, partial [Streptomyces oryziradicis]|nr:glycosyl hydrolase [Actinacidiphila oryziradicis]
MRPVVPLIGYARVPLGPGATAGVRFTFHADLASYTVREGLRIVEPGALELRLATSSVDVRHTVQLTLTGGERAVDHR